MNKPFPFLSANSFCRSYICLTILALFLGGMIYILFRASDPVFFSWLDVLVSDSWISSVRYDILSLNIRLPEWFVFSLPNGLWAFAYALLITCIWSGSEAWIRYIWMASIPLLVVGFEILQYPGIIPGTFCMQDIALGMTGLIAGLIIGNKPIKPYNHEKNYE